MAIEFRDIEVIRFATYLQAMAQEITKKRSAEKSTLKLLAAGARLLETDHYRDLLVQAICEEAGVAKGTFYIYYDTKDIFLRNLAQRFVNFEFQTYPRFSSKNTPFENTRRWVYWYEKTFAANVGIFKCMVQMGEQDAEMRAIWHERNGRISERSLAGWMKTHQDRDLNLQRWVLRTSGLMLDQSLFERYGVQTGPGLEEPKDPDFLIDLHALLNFRALYGHDPSPDEFKPDSPFRQLLVS